MVYFVDWHSQDRIQIKRKTLDGLCAQIRFGQEEKTLSQKSVENDTLSQRNLYIVFILNPRMNKV